MTTLTDLDALVARLNDAAYRFGDSYPVDAARQREAAAALVQLREENARLTARVQQRDKQIAVYNSGGFADADALAEKFIDLTNRIAALEAERDALKERRG